MLDVVVSSVPNTCLLEVVTQLLVLLEVTLLLLLVSPPLLQLLYLVKQLRNALLLPLLLPLATPSLVLGLSVAATVSLLTS
jgi:hypothetical protein